MTRENDSGSDSRHWLASLAVLPGIGASLLPAVACPACWPAYAGLLGSLGVGFIDYTPWLLPLTLLFLLVALGALLRRGLRERAWGPFVLGLGGSVLLTAGKFVLENDPLLYGGLALLIAASVWNAWPRKVCAAPDGNVRGCG